MKVLSKKALENKREYNRKRTRELLKSFSTTLPKEEHKEISDYLAQIGMNKAEFIRWAYDKLREE